MKTRKPKTGGTRVGDGKLSLDRVEVTFTDRDTGGPTDRRGYRMGNLRLDDPATGSNDRSEQPVSETTNTMIANSSHGQDLLLSVHRLLKRKWQPVILLQLHDHGPMRFSELKQAIDGISSKVLSDNLSNLEENGLIERSVVKQKPPRVEYVLTDHGESLDSVLGEMLQWGRVHLDNQPPAEKRESSSPSLKPL